MHAKLVYVTLTSYSDAAGRSWPSHATIATDCGISVSSVQRGMKWLRDNGHLTWTAAASADGGQTSNRYTIHTPPVSVTDPPGPCDRRTIPTERDPEEQRSVDAEVNAGNGDSSDLAPSPVPTVGTATNPETVKARPPRAWEPAESARARAESNAQCVDVDLHIDRYLIRSRERGKQPSNEEWLRWFLDDEQKARSEARQQDTEGAIDEVGVPRSWR